jgi:hypothetical protein
METLRKSRAASISSMKYNGVGWTAWLTGGGLDHNIFTYLENMKRKDQSQGAQCLGNTFDQKKSDYYK